tara:strand:+ start:37 stop:465 length:429 start_codon:yes stop_codon:yes gene_type:complete
MLQNFTIKNPNWPRELTFEEFKRNNFHIKNENQLINFYNEYHRKYLEELLNKKLNFKKRHFLNLQENIKKLKTNNNYVLNSLIGATSTAVGGFNAQVGIGNYSVGTHLNSDKSLSLTPSDDGFIRFTVGRPIVPSPDNPGYI